MFHTKQKHSYKYVSGDIRWDELNTIKYPLVCSMAGLVAGMSAPLHIGSISASPPACLAYL